MTNISSGFTFWDTDMIVRLWGYQVRIRKVIGVLLCSKGSILIRIWTTKCTHSEHFSKNSAPVRVNFVLMMTEIAEPLAEAIRMEENENGRNLFIIFCWYIMSWVE